MKKKYRVVDEERDRYKDFSYKKDLLRWMTTGANTSYTFLDDVRVFMFKKGIIYCGFIYVEKKRLKVIF